MVMDMEATATVDTDTMVIKDFMEDMVFHMEVIMVDMVGMEQESLIIHIVTFLVMVDTI